MLQPHLGKHGADTLKGMQKPYWAEMPGELSKLNRPCEKLKTVSLPPIPSRLRTHARVREPSGTRKKRSPLALVTQKRKTLRKEFHCHLARGKDSDRDLDTPKHPSPLQKASAKRGQRQGILCRHHRSPRLWSCAI